MTQEKTVTVLGGGVSGCLTACLLSDRGVHVTLVDRHTAMMSGASRWNEGKIHLGYTYTGTPSLATARLMQEGAAVFEDVIEGVAGERLHRSWYSGPVIYLVDRDSMLTVDVLWKRAVAVANALSECATRHRGLTRYCGGTDGLERLNPQVAADATVQERIAGAWRTSEVAVDPGPVAELIRRAVSDRPIDIVQGNVVGAEPLRSGWSVLLADGRSLAADVVVNALWESRPALDVHIGGPAAPVSIRYKSALFGTGLTQLGNLAPSTRILGRFGDVTPYANGGGYLSWYPSGLAAASDAGVPPVVPSVLEDVLVASTLRGLALDPAVLESGTARWEVHGGFVVAHGHGDIDRLESPLHDRHYPDARELRPGYISVDTGKYSLGPLMALRAASLASRRLGLGNEPRSFSSEMEQAWPR